MWNISSRHSLQLSFLSNVADDIDLGLDALHPVSTTLTQHAHQVFGSVKDQYWFDDTLVEFGAGHDSHDDYEPQGNAPYKLLVDGAAGNYFQALQQDGRRWQGFVDATRAGLKWHGTHTVSAGADLSSVRLEQASTRGEIQALYGDNTTIRPGDDVHGARRIFAWPIRWRGRLCRIRGRSMRTLSRRRECGPIGTGWCSRRWRNRAWR